MPAPTPDLTSIKELVSNATRGLENPQAKLDLLVSEIALASSGNISEKDLVDLGISCAVQNIKDDPDFETIAVRILLTKIYREVLKSYPADGLNESYRAGFSRYIKKAVAEGYLDERLLTRFDLEKLSGQIVPERDFLLKYLGLITMMKRYMLLDAEHRIMETPQYFWLRVAMGLSFNEEAPTEKALLFYEKISNLEYLPAGSTLIGAGRPVPHLSNCFVMQMEDSISHIGKTVLDVMQLTKATGGIGLSVTKLRAEGSPIKTSNTFSSGPVPFMHTIDSAIRAVSRAGKKLGALCFYMENWHINFSEFLDLKQNAGDEYRRTRTANTAVYISDEFMRRVAANTDWYLFDPAQTPDLSELYGEAFSLKYRQYEALAKTGQLRVYKVVKARELFKEILLSLQTTSHPWITWKDAINVRALNNNTGTIHLSNLCTEICLPQDEKNIAVCNLASVNLSKHVAGGEINFEKLAATVRVAVRQLDNLIDITNSAVPEAEHANKANRAVGLGVMGFTDVTEKMGLAYESEAAYDFADKIFEFISFTAIDESANLSQERGSYPNFQGSRWSQGLVPFDSLALLDSQRGREIKVDRQTSLDWSPLREKVKKGMRNATVLAIAPTASIGLVAGTTPGIDPQFAQLFSRTTNYGKFLEVNTNLVKDLKKIGVWEKVRDKILQNYGEIENIEEIPAKIKSIYQTSFNISPSAFIEIAARAQKWIDQSLSRNMYLSTRSVEEMVEIYSLAWEKGLKTTYYLHVKPRHSAEQSTQKVNKGESLGKKGFAGLDLNDNPGTLGEAALVGSIKTGDACPTDPAERISCESCQ